MCAEHEAIAEMLLEQVDSGVVHLDDTGTLVFLNRKAEQILGVSRNEILGKRVDMLPLRTPIYRVLSENSHDTPVEISEEGTVMSVRSTPLPGSGERHGEFFELRDITCEKREKWQREEFVAMMTHDLKSPLTVIMGYSELITTDMADKVDKTVMEMVTNISNAAGRLDNIIKDMVDVSLIDEKRLQLKMEDIHLNRLIEAAVNELMRTVVALGGAISGEHGIGLAKTPFLRVQHRAAQVKAMRAVKDALDPRGILNPGKMFEPVRIWKFPKLTVHLPWDHK